MRYFLDCEFNGFGGAFISIGLAPEAADAPPFYEATACENPTPWVKEAVTGPVLGDLISLPSKERCTTWHYRDTFWSCPKNIRNWKK